MPRVRAPDSNPSPTSLVSSLADAPCSSRPQNSHYTGPLPGAAETVDVDDDGNPEQTGGQTGGGAAEKQMNYEINNRKLHLLTQVASVGPRAFLTSAANVKTGVGRES